jgi:hypothetical protein
MKATAARPAPAGPLDSLTAIQRFTLLADSIVSEPATVSDALAGILERWLIVGEFPESAEIFAEALQYIEQRIDLQCWESEEEGRACQRIERKLMKTSSGALREAARRRSRFSGGRSSAA